MLKFSEQKNYLRHVLGGREEEYTFCYFLVMRFDAEICLAICCSPTGLEGKKVFLRDKKKDFIPSLLSDLLQEKNFTYFCQFHWTNTSCRTPARMSTSHLSLLCLCGKEKSCKS